MNQLWYVGYNEAGEPFCDNSSAKMTPYRTIYCYNEPSAAQRMLNLLMSWYTEK